jgi:hypothetical protein
MDANEQKQSFQSQLESVGVPVSLASQCAEILVKDDPFKDNLGRSKEDVHLIHSAHTWMTARGGQS